MLKAYHLIRCSAATAFLLATFGGYFFGGSILAAAEGAAEIETQPVLLQMIRDDAIHEELGLSEEQVRQVYESLKQIDGPWFRVRIRPVQERIATIADLTRQLDQSLRSILDPSQRERLNQLQNQALGTRMIVRPETSRALQLSDDKREALIKVFQDTDKKVADLQQQVQKGDMEQAEAGRKINAAKTAERKAFNDALNNEQKRQLASLTGNGFNFARVKRMYPAAPELSEEGASWLQGQGLKLDELKGKVVALHFYAFQCINCRRNLPHYNGWHTDYADDGLVVIGIQTPETSAERSAARVTEAIGKEKIEYPILMDASSSNWKQWSNTMWPTVYLIDKKGFLRRWWQGEMNWKGTPGELQMRETIESLLEEEG